jgi:ABC-2 type transport system ATP-binding protein
MEDLVQIENLSKSYGKHQALKNVSFTVPRGKVFALLGPNGAGKSTLVKCLLHLIHLNDGSIKIDGHSYSDLHCREVLSYLPEKFSFYPFYNVQGVLDFFASLKGLKGSEKKQRIEKVIELMGIEDFKKQKVNQLSKGQLQRTGIAVTLLGENQLIILDEPFSGLDPIAIRELKELVVKLKEEGKTVFINSHLLGEMESIVDSCVLLDKGELIAKGNLPEMLNGKTLEEFFYAAVKGEEV